MSLRKELREYISRKLQPGEPETWIDGGGSSAKNRFTGQTRTREDLEVYQNVYEKGGPIAQMVDARAYMIFGTGSSFEAAEDLETVVEGESITLTEWLDDTFSNRDELFPRIGRDCYVYGESDTETVETRGGGFSHVELINPKTLTPTFDDTGQITSWTQTIKSGHQERTQELNGDAVGHFVLQKLGRQVGGISLIGRGLDEIQRYGQNQESREKYLRRYGNPKRHVRVGKDNGPAIDDIQLKKVRNRIRHLNEDDDIVSGKDIEISSIDEFGGADITDTTEIDLKQLAIAMGIPLELADIGGDGMGTGTPAELRLRSFERQGNAEQDMLARQFVEQIVRPVLEKYSPFPSDVDITLNFDEIVTDKSDKANWINTAMDVMTIDEIRNEFGFGPFEGDESELGPPEKSNEGGLFMEDGTPRREALISSAQESGTLYTEGLGFASKEAAEQKAQQMGCSGAHQMEIGGTTMWVPCSSHESFERNKPTFTRTQSEGKDAFEALLEIHDTAVNPEKGERKLFNFDDEDVPEFAKEWMRRAIQFSDAFDDIQTLPASAVEGLQDVMLDSLETQHGWSINSLRDNIQDFAPELSNAEAERLGRTLTQNIVANAREIGYEQRDMEDISVKWAEIEDGRETERCDWIADQTKEGVSMQQLEETIDEAVDRFPDEGPRPGKWTPHINCRRTFFRTQNRTNSRAMQDIEDIDMGDYPDAAVENAQMALDAREETGNPNDCGTQVGWERANQFVNGEDFTEDTIGRIAAFERHQDNKEQGEEGRADCGWMMWNAWGGDEGINWAQNKLDEIENAREMADEIPGGNNRYTGGDIVMFGWEDGEPTVGRIVRSDSESITLGETTVTGEPNEFVYLLELENGAMIVKPESKIRPADGNTEETTQEVE